MNTNKIMQISKNKKKEIEEDILNLFPAAKEVLENDESEDDVIRFICKVCDKSILSKNLTNHFEDSKAHLRKMKNNGKLELNTSIIKVLKGESVNSPELEENAKNILKHNNEEDDPMKVMFKLEVTKFIISQELPYSIIDDLLDFIKHVVTNYEKDTLCTTSLSRDLVSKIARFSIADTIQEKIFCELKDSPYSLAIDEASDHFGTSYLAVTAKYLEPDNMKNPITKLLSIIEMDEDKTGEALFNSLNSIIFSKDPLLEKNFMGIVTDQASSMVGIEQGLATRLQEKFPYILACNDISHIFNLICKYCVKSYPNSIIEIIQDICSHFSYSCQRRARFKKIREDVDPEAFHDILRYTPVRWLSLSKCLNRIIDLWASLKAYFNKYGDESEKEYFSQENELYLRNLNDIIDFLAHYNIEFQKELKLYDSISEDLEESFLIFAKMVVVGDKKLLPFDEMIKIPFENTANSNTLTPLLLDLKGFIARWLEDHPHLKELAKALPDKTQEKVFEDTKKVILTVLSQMKKRLPFRQNFIKESQVIFLKEWNIDSWKMLVDRFTNMISLNEVRHFHNELKRFEINFFRHAEEHKKSGKTPLETWYSLSNQYPYMSKLAKALLVLPSSTVPVERIFSQMQDIKTPKRNRLHTENLEAALLIYQTYGSSNFEITPKMIEKYHATLKQKNNKEKSETIQKEKENSESSTPRKFRDLVSLFKDILISKGADKEKIKKKVRNAEQVVTEFLSSALIKELEQSEVSNESDEELHPRLSMDSKDGSAKRVGQSEQSGSKFRLITQDVKEKQKKKEPQEDLSK